MKLMCALGIVLNCQVMIKRIFILLLVLNLFSCVSGPRLHKPRWLIIHEQTATDEVKFVRQAHGGSAYDSRRGRLILFGSDTHGDDWQNNVYFFDIEKRQWQTRYAPDEPATYHVNKQGIAVAGQNSDHPWAMHTFAALSYDELHDALVVSSYPKHMQPGRFTSALESVWHKVKSHPTWILNLQNNKWNYLPSPAVHFFPYTTRYDPFNGRVIGYRDDGVYQLSLKTKRWKQLTKKSYLGYHNNSVVDLRHKCLIVMGSDENRNDVVVFNLLNGDHRIMPTAGIRPPKAQHFPMAYHQRLGVTVALIEAKQTAKKKTQTWIYDLGRDSWRRIASADLNFPLGMNYNMEYDSLHDTLLLVTEKPKGVTSVWALKL